MKKILVLSGLFLALAACAAPTPDPTATPSPSPVPPAETAAPATLVWRDQTIEETFSDDDGTVLMNISFLLPGVSSAEANPAWTAIDRFYHAEGESYLTSAQAEADQADADRDIADSLGYDFTPYSAESFYSLTLQTDAVASFRRTYYSDWGGAYPTVFQFSESFRLSDGTRLTFSDLFPDGEGAKAVLLPLIRAKLEAREDAEVLDFDRLETTFQEDAFYLTADSVVFYYQEYDLAPHAAGILEAAIPYDELKDVLAPW